MKKISLCLLLAVLVLFVASCFSGFFEDKNETVIGDKNPYTTRVQFDNRAGAHKVQLFNNGGRTSQIGGDVQKGYMSSLADCPHGNPYTFFVTYFLNINGAEIPYVPASGKGDHFQYPVPRGEDTVVPVPTLASSGITNDEILITSYIYLNIQNRGGRMVELFAGGVGGASAMQEGINGEKNIPHNGQVIYRLSNPNLTNLNIRPSGIADLPFPVYSYQRGYVYLFEYTSNGTFDLMGGDPITLLNSLQ